MIEQVADTAADQLQAPRRQDARLDDAPYDQFRQVRGARCRLDDRRHAGRERRCEFLEHAPHGEVERIDVYRGAQLRRVDVLSDERAVTR